MKKIGILGGSFDPIHNGHINIAVNALIKRNLDFVCFMPTKKNPFKAGKDQASDEDRLAMLKAAIGQNTSFCIIDDELKDKNVSYTYNTMENLSKNYVGCHLYFIIGSDSLMSMEKWYRGEDLLKNFSFIVALRPGQTYEELENKVNELVEKYDADIDLMEMDVLDDSSSTEIRELLKNGGDISYMVPPKVKEYIYEHGLYL
ncbi:MAG: nicotinate-nucleotide adenylyltransferase [Clostridia bacterium]|nr:nicotinate-nucleotide adenylyltransferase [Clostridia bacterium]